MKRFISMLCAGSLALCLWSCGGTHLSVKQIDPWLAAQKTAAPQVNLSGRWDAGSSFSGGWGEGNFVQEDREVTGSLGMYYVKGVVSGTDVYLAIMSGDEIAYTARLSQKPDGSFFGKAVYYAIIDTPEAQQAEAYPISFTKMN